MCADKPCWKPKNTKGWGYADKAATASGIKKLGFTGGSVGGGGASAEGKNDAAKGLTSLPGGLVASLHGQTHPTLQLTTSHGLCVGATLNTVTKDVGLQYKAAKK